jgi:hypothetical protein
VLSARYKLTLYIRYIGYGLQRVKCAFNCYCVLRKNYHEWLMKKIETGRLHHLGGTSRKITRLLSLGMDGLRGERGVATYQLRCSVWRRNVPTKRLSITSSCINVNRGQVCRRSRWMCVTDGRPAYRQWQTCRVDCRHSVTVTVGCRAQSLAMYGRPHSVTHISTGL